MSNVLKKALSLHYQTTKKVVIWKQLKKKHPVHYRVAYCNEIFPTLASAKKYVYINYNPQEHSAYVLPTYNYQNQ